MAETKKTVTAKSGAAGVKTEEKKVVKKAAAPKAPVKKTTVKTEPKAKTSTVNLSVDVFDLTGKVSGKLSLPAEIFGEKVNKALLHQAIRVYQANKRQGNASTKTRGEVDGSSKKIYRQKGTGRARHGTLRAPIFVKGGIVHGPKPRDFSLDFPKKMRRKALFSALSSKLLDGQLTFLAGVESMEPKTKKFAGTLKSLGVTNTNVLLVMPSELTNVKRATRNVPGVTTTVAGRLNALDVLKSRQILLSRDAVAEMKKTFLPKE